MDVFGISPINSSEWDILSAHLEALSNLNGKERMAYLSGIQEKTPELYEWVINLSLATNDFGHVVDQAKNTLNGVRTMTQTEDMVGYQLGHYQLIEKIGEGGMGEVYLAKRVDGFEQKVAIKIFRYVFINQRFARRFEQEQHILAHLSHPCIAAFIDAGESDAGIPFLVMEHIDGQDIKSYTFENGAKLEACINCILQICDALQYLHNNLVIHRDIKPNNILVTKSGHVKLLDFGIAKKLTESSVPSQNTLTHPFQHVLTPNYASPEQIFGKPVSALSDVYSVGVLLYELVTGQVPYNVASTNLSDLNAMFSRKPKRPSQIGQKAALRGRVIDRDLDTIIMKALSFEVNRRYKSADALREDLQRWLNRDTILAKPQTWQYKLYKFITRERSMVSAIVLLFILLTTGFLVTFWQSRQIQRHAERTNQVIQFLEHVLVGYDPLSMNPIIQDSTASKQLVRNSLDYLKQLPQEQDIVRTRILNLLSAISLGQNRLAQADSLNRLAQKTSSISTDTHIQAQVLLQKAKVCLHKLRYQEGIVAANEGLALVSDSDIETLKIRRDLLNLKATLLMTLEDWNTARVTLDVATPLTLQIFGEKSLEYAVQLASYANLFSYMGQHETAVALIQKSINIYDEKQKGDIPFVSSLYSNLGFYWQEAGKFDRAIAAMEKSIQISKKIFGSYHHDVICSQINKALMYAEAGDLNSAAHLLKEILPYSEPSGGETLHTIYYNLAYVLQDAGNISEAKIWAEKVFAIWSKVLPVDHVDMLRAEFILGELHQEAGENTVAERYFSAILSATKNKKPTSSRYVLALLRIAWIRLSQNKLVEADHCIQEAKTLSNEDQVKPVVVLELQALEGWMMIKKGDASKGNARIQETIKKLKNDFPQERVLLRMLSKLK